MVYFYKTAATKQPLVRLKERRRYMKNWKISKFKRIGKPKVSVYVLHPGPASRPKKKLREAF